MAPANLFSSLSISGIFSDLKIICRTDTYRVHKAIVASQSPWFAQACREGTFKEGRENVIVLPHDEGDTLNAGLDDPTAVRWMMHFLYNGKYPNLSEMRDQALITHAKIYVLGDKYDIPGLKEEAARHFQIITVIHDDIPALVKAAQLLYDNVPESDKALKNIIINFVLQRDYLAEVFVEGPEKDLLRTTPGFAMDLLRSICENSYGTLGEFGSFRPACGEDDGGVEYENETY